MDSDQGQSIHRKRKLTSPLLEEVSDSPSQIPPREALETVTPRQQQQGSQWSPGILKRFPYLGILSLIGCVLCIAASVAILVASDGQPVTNWSVSPTVYLAFLTTALNALARFAFSEGAKITWWSAAIRGTTISHLHRYWAGGDSVLSVVWPGRGFNVVSLAKLAATLIAIDQPLIQRASSIVPRQLTTSVSVTAPIAPEIPYGYTGIQQSRAQSVSAISMKLPMVSAFGGYNSKSPITHNFTGCADNCTGIVRASGFGTNCSVTNYEVNPWSFVDDGSDTVAESVSPFNVSWNINLDPSNHTAYITSLAYYVYDSLPEGICNASKLMSRNCNLYSATLEYPVQLQGNTLTFTEAIDNLTVVSIQPPADQSYGTDDGYLGFGWTTVGFGIAATILFNSAATYTFAGGSSGLLQLNLPDVTSSQFVNITAANSEGCATWADPTPYMISAMNEMAFRLSIEASNATYRNTSKPSPPQTLTMTQRNNVNVYHSDYKYLIAETVLSLFFVLLIIPTFYGWWLLGRNVSLNPIETAKAFDAPLLRGPGSNASQEGLARIMGMRKLKLGDVEEFDGEQVVGNKLKFVNPTDALGPRSGEFYQ